MRKIKLYKDQFRKKIKNIERIKEWLFKNLDKDSPKKGKIRIYVYDARNKKLSGIIFSIKYYI
jgi:hypothetical protein